MSPPPKSDLKSSPRAAAPTDSADAEFHPSEKSMGLVQLTLDRGVRTTAIGHLYGLDFEIEGKGFKVRVFFDHYSRRLKVIDYEATQLRAMVARLRWLSRENKFDKVFLFAHEEDWRAFLSFGFLLEGIFPRYHSGKDAFVMSHFGSQERAYSPYVVEESGTIEAIMSKPPEVVSPVLPAGYTECLAEERHIPGMIRLYKRIFKTYPSPLTAPDYVQQTMQRHIIYRVIIGPDGQTLSAASAEMDEKHSAAELSDCATRHSERGKGLMYLLLMNLERDLLERGIKTGFTYARARSAAMNKVFYRLGYEYTGRLVNSCDISGQMEDMNLWVKPLAAKEG